VQPDHVPGQKSHFEADYGNLQWTETGERLTEETFLKYREEQPGGTVVLHVIPEEMARYAMAHPVVSIASDGMPWTSKGERPRGAGTYGRVLGKYVRQEGALDLMLALRLEKSVLVPMRDGVRLSTDIYSPAGVEGPLPDIAGLPEACHCCFRADRGDYCRRQAWTGGADCKRLRVYDLGVHPGICHTGVDDRTGPDSTA
jgi:hypothetical protein